MNVAPVARIDADVAVVGSGFSGSLTALALCHLGRRVALIERGRHPRFAIGESSTPLANLLIEELADRYELPGVKVFSKWGTWQAARPEIAGGVKRGFTFLFHSADEPFRDDDDRASQLLVAASPHDGVADTHWYRPDVDHALVRQAEEAGAIYVDETQLERLTQSPSSATLDGVRRGRSLRVRARFVVDASGPRGFLHRTLGLGERPPCRLPATQALYAHFTEVDRIIDSVKFEDTPPFPPDEAAVHHVFPGGWIWVLRFNNGVTSAGAALTDAIAERMGPGAGGWDRLLSTLPSVQSQFRRARTTVPFVHAPRLAFHSAEVAGARWALLPSAAGVVDPLLSTGFPLTLLGVSRLLTVLEGADEGDRRAAALREYARTTHEELDATERLVAALYATMGDPPLFKRVTKLYFAAASFSEAARRLGQPALAPGFLLHAHPQFGPGLRECAELASQPPCGAARAALCDRIDRVIEPFDIAGLLDERRRSWYPVIASDLIAAAPKLHATAEQVQQLLKRSGFQV